MAKPRLLKTLMFPIDYIRIRSAWTINTNRWEREAFEMEAYRTRVVWGAVSGINKSVLKEARNPYLPVLTCIKRRMIAFAGHIMPSNGLEKMFLREKVSGLPMNSINYQK